MKTLADHWLSYEADVLPATAGATQRRETRRGFYAGARALFAILDGAASEDLSDDQGVARLEVINQELAAFARDIGAGKA